MTKTSTPLALLRPRTPRPAGRLAASLAAGLGCCSLLAVGCGSPPEPAAAPQRDPAAVIARYKDGEIRRGEIQVAIDRNLASQPPPVTPEARRAIVRKIVERRVRTQMILSEALAKGYADSPEVKIRQAAAADRVLAEDLLESAAAGVAASDAVVAAEIDRRLAAEAPAEETRRFSHIYLKAAESDAGARRAAQAAMAKIGQELAAGADFGELAQKYSQSVMARGGGRIDWTTAGKLQPAARRAVFGLAQEGELSPVVETADGLHLFRLDGIRRPSPIDAAAIRAAVRQELDAEAKNAALRARREQALDAGGAEFAPAGRLERLGETLDRQQPLSAGAAWLARWQGGELGEAEVAALHGRVLPNRQPVLVELRLLTENRLLAAQRRAAGLTPELEAKVAEAERQAIIDSYRGDVMVQLDTPPSEEEILRYYRDNAAGNLALRDFQVDALFFPQQGESIAEVYAAGEEVVAGLREGTDFDRLLARPPRPEATVCREAHGVSLEEVGTTSIRLRKALANLADGEISPAIYIEREVPLAAACRLPGPGVVFVRLRGVATLPLEAARPAIVQAIVKERVEQGVTVFQQRLIAESGLEILVPEG